MPDDIELKQQFAKLMRSEGEPFKAALLLFPDDTPKALRIAYEWPKDEIVKTALEELRNETSGVPTKAELMAHLWKRLEHCEDKAIAPISTLLANLAGYVEKANDSNNLNSQRQVVEIPVFNSREEFQAYAERQQAELLKNARTRD